MDQQSAINIASFTWVDYSIIVVIAFSVFISLIRGFVREVLSLATWVAAFFMALNYAVQVGNLFAKHISSQTTCMVLGGCLLFIGTLIIGAIINYFISTLVDKTGLSGTDRALGLVLGGARGVFLVAIMVLLASYTSISTQQAWKGSLLLPHFSACANWIQGFIPDASQFISGQ